MVILSFAVAFAAGWMFDWAGHQMKNGRLLFLAAVLALMAQNTNFIIRTLKLYTQTKSSFGLALFVHQTHLPVSRSTYAMAIITGRQTIFIACHRPPQLSVISWLIIGNWFISYIFAISRSDSFDQTLKYQSWVFTLQLPEWVLWWSHCMAYQVTRKITISSVDSEIPLLSLFTFSWQILWEH